MSINGVVLCDGEYRVVDSLFGEIGKFIGEFDGTVYDEFVPIKYLKGFQINGKWFSGSEKEIRSQLNGHFGDIVVRKEGVYFGGIKCQIDNPYKDIKDQLIDGIVEELIED